MGYTHYWETSRDFTDAEWAELMQDADDLIAASDVHLRIERNAPNEPAEVTVSEIRFNGLGAEGHETFVFHKDKHSNFCKTNRKPYDAIVVKILAHAHSIAPDAVYLGSDGNSQPGETPVVNIFEQVLTGDYHA